MKTVLIITWKPVGFIQSCFCCIVDTFCWILRVIILLCYILLCVEDILHIDLCKLISFIFVKSKTYFQDLYFFIFR